MKKSKKLKQNMANSIFPIYLLGRFAGVVPYSLNIVDHERKPSTSRKDIFYILIYVISYTLIDVYNMRSLYKNDKAFEVIPKFAIMILTFMLVSLVFLYMMLCLGFRSFVTNIYKRMDVLDDHFKSIKINMDYLRTRKLARRKTFIIVVSSLIRSILMIQVMHLNFSQLLFLFAAAMAKAAVKNHFMFFVLEVRDRYQKINDKIHTMFVPKTQGFQQETSDHVNHVMKMLYVLCRIHYKLRKIIQCVITAYSVQLLFYLGAALANIIFQSYFIYVIISIADLKKTVFFFASSLTWLIDEVYELFTLVDACASACNTAAETATILHQLQNNIKNIELENHIQMYSLQMLHQGIQFSVLGFVTIDYSLLYSIIGAVTTYLVILIQFNQAQGDPPSTAMTITTVSTLISTSLTNVPEIS